MANAPEAAKNYHCQHATWCCRIGWLIIRRGKRLEVQVEFRRSGGLSSLEIAASITKTTCRSSELHRCNATTSYRSCTLVKCGEQNRLKGANGVSRPAVQCRLTCNGTIYNGILGEGTVTNKRKRIDRAHEDTVVTACLVRTNTHLDDGSLVSSSGDLSRCQLDVIRIALESLYVVRLVGRLG